MCLCTVTALSLFVFSLSVNSPEITEIPSFNSSAWSPFSQKTCYNHLAYEIGPWRCHKGQRHKKDVSDCLEEGPRECQFSKEAANRVLNKIFFEGGSSISGQMTRCYGYGDSSSVRDESICIVAIKKNNTCQRPECRARAESMQNQGAPFRLVCSQRQGTESQCPLCQLYTANRDAFVNGGY